MRNAGTNWIPWEKFVELVTACRGCPSASSLSQISQKYDRNPHVSKTKMNQVVSKTNQAVVRPEMNQFVAQNLLVASFKELDSGLILEQLHTDPDEWNSSKSGRFERLQNFGIPYICRIHAVFKRIYDEFRYLTRMRRLLKIRVLVEIEQVTAFLHDTGEVHFPGLNMITQMNTYRQRKAEIVEQLTILGEQKKKNALNAIEKKALISLKNDMDDMKVKLKTLTIACDGMRYTTIFVSPLWILYSIKGLMNENLSKLHKYLLTNKMMGLALAVECMMTSGVIRADLIPFLRPHTCETSKYWDTFQNCEQGQAMWPGDVDLLNKDVSGFERVFVLLESLDLMHKTSDGNYVASVITNAKLHSMPAAAYCDDLSPFKVHLVYNELPTGFLSRIILHCRKTTHHVNFDVSMATFYNQETKTVISVVNVKDPASVLPADVVESGKQELGDNKWKSDRKAEEIKKAFLKKTGGENQDQDHLDAAIDKVFRDLQKTTDGDLGGLELDQDEVEQGLKSLGVTLSKKDTIKLFASADKDGGGTIDGREFKLMVKSLFRQSQYKRLKPDQVHVIIKCSTKEDREKFILPACTGEYLAFRC